MDITIHPSKLHGTIVAIPSKSQAHRLLICAAFSDSETNLYCPETNRDIEATADCLRSLGATIIRNDAGYIVKPIMSPPAKATLSCGESGSTLRFMLPIVGALGVDATFRMEGRLPYRPLSPLWEEMERMGCTITRPTEDTLRCQGQLSPGQYSIDGSISSQYITGLLYALSLIPGNSALYITGNIESRPYIEMTERALELFGVDTSGYKISGGSAYQTPGVVTIEGDWSNGAFFLAAKALGCNLDITGLDPSSAQGDRAVQDILIQLNKHTTIDAADIPDLVPILAIVAAAKHGAIFQNIQRLRLKESDRVASVAAMLESFGITVHVDDKELTVEPGSFRGCIIDSAADHRIAMAAAIGATIAKGPVTILGAQCVAKSYPSFWDEYKRLGGSYEQHIR